MTENHKINLIVLDVDDTVLNSQHELSERNEKAIKAAIESGVPVALATGKTRSSSKFIIERTGINAPSIFTQGLIIYNPDGTISYQQTLDPAVARRVITFAEGRGADVVAYSGERLLTRTESPRVSWLGEKYREPMPEGIGALQNILGEIPVNKLMLICKDDPKRMAALRWQMEKQLDGDARIMEIMLKDSIEILPAGASKANALRILLKSMGIAAANVMAVGDGRNDIGMLEMVGLGVAVGNAHDDLKAVADHVVASNDDDGVAEAIERFVLQTESQPESQPEGETSDTTEAEITEGEAK